MVHMDHLAMYLPCMKLPVDTVAHAVLALAPPVGAARGAHRLLPPGLGPGKKREEGCGKENFFYRKKLENVFSPVTFLQLEAVPGGRAHLFLMTAHWQSISS